ncbi:MAG: hypothetical protein RL060_1804, partial [Bacteroidota bacterium]
IDNLLIFVFNMTRYEFTGVKTLENLQGYLDEYHWH